MSGADRMVGIGECAVSQGDARMAIYGLGSCVALILFDPATRRVGMAHVLLPGTAPGGERPEDLPAKFAEDALALLVEGLGAERGLSAVIVGGAHLFAAEGPAERRVGNRNVESLKEALRARGIPLAWEDTGGEAGRTVTVELPACVVSVRTLREGWRASYRLG